MEQDNNLGLMGRIMLVNGKITKLVEKVSLHMHKVTTTREYGLTIKQMATAFTLILTEPSIEDIGRMIYNMEPELKLG